MDRQSKPSSGEKTPGRPKKAPTRKIVFRIPEEAHAELVAYAAVKGQEVAAVLKRLVAEARPAMLREVREHRAALGESNGHETKEPSQ